VVSIHRCKGGIRKERARKDNSGSLEKRDQGLEWSVHNHSSNHGDFGLVAAVRTRCRRSGRPWVNGAVGRVSCNPRWSERCLELVCYKIEYVEFGGDQGFFTHEGFQFERFLERKASKFSLQSCVQCFVKAIAATPITKTIYILPCFSVERIYAWHQPKKQGAERGE